MPQNKDIKDNEKVDLLVIGGGINGCGIARDAAGRGLKVLLCEKDDLASHTSSASTKLIHGGLRYLENYDFLLVRHALKEREILLNSAPHIIWPLRFILPHHEGLRPRWLLRLGLFLYDYIGGRKRLPASTGINLKKHIAGKFLKQKFTHAFEYSDCGVQDARLVVMNARDAARLGANIMTHTACTGLTRHEDYWSATIEESKSGQKKTIIAKAVVNASGPWVENTLGLVSKTISSRSVRLVKGSHIIVKKIFDHDYPYIFQHDDGRILFAIPFENDFTLLGTTDHDYHGDVDKVKIDQQEIDYICEAISHYAETPVTPDQVIWSYSGVRPLFGDESGNASKVSRDYELELDHKAAPIVSVYGGKVTTFRILSEQAIDLLQEPLNIKKSAWTENSYMPGGNIQRADFDKFVSDCQLKYSWLDKAVVRDYCRSYGTDIDNILQGLNQADDLGIYFGGGLYEKEVIYLIENEWAQSSEDILWRRSKKGLRLNTEEVKKLQQWMSGSQVKNLNSAA
ncbi:MAG: glycerol-3-phosphate dehydrogenase [Gammaproteobacteria bacterium]|jgi:glycerol-3-phosphate dehydrogenase|nr:glycerol-3-phosphate dehydrogenase [Gammaproteobacteria bacterium]MBT3723002.1 glycerol-3-phosphate dehydrogenase [Gammaproteobacteria bacterium]MBT4452010.1 glycerol-3-phosphate dehydrogenase [Gammaproteobacteria bacterium]MBT4861828.1 glycerol-3-phosphate dehydrogenase [Gammaproteobacteria bacterium]MBT6457550.1 glycerol-3-phosphate dehydrogenase [Gammaproteobacteria bacterium]